MDAEVEKICSTKNTAGMTDEDILAEYEKNGTRLSAGNLAGWVSGKVASRQSQLAQVYIERNILSMRKK